MISSEKHKNYILNTVCTETDLLEIQQFILRNIKEWAESHLIWDFSVFDFSQVAAEDIKNSLGNLSAASKIREHLKTIFVVENDLQFGILRSLEAYAKMRDIAIEFHTVKSLDEAINLTQER